MDYPDKPCLTCVYWTHRYKDHTEHYWGICEQTTTHAGRSMALSTAFAYAEDYANAWLATRGDHSCSMYEREGRT